MTNVAVYMYMMLKYEYTMNTGAHPTFDQQCWAALITEKFFLHGAETSPPYNYLRINFSFVMQRRYAFLLHESPARHACSSFHFTRLDSSKSSGPFLT